MLAANLGNGKLQALYHAQQGANLQLQEANNFAEDVRNCWWERRGDKVGQNQTTREGDEEMNCEKDKERENECRKV